jgi:uncharacterized protein
MSAPAVTHNAALQRFECEVAGHLCVADYVLQGRVMRMIHTEVHPALQGQGIASALVAAAVIYAQTQGLRIDPACSYVRAYSARHPQPDVWSA